MTFAATLALARPAAMRFARTPRGLIPLIAWTIFAIAIALAARARASGADHVLRGSFAFFVLPLFAYSIVGATLGAAGLRRAIRGVVAIGAVPWRAALAYVGVATISSAVLGALLAGLVCALAHASHDPPLLRDLPASMWIAALGGASYGAYFSAGAALGRAGVLRGAFLVIDWVVGAGSGFGALFTPRGHVLSLLGGPPCAELSQRSSSAVLVVLVLVYAAFAVRKAHKA